jgi:hypothetical protein
VRAQVTYSRIFHATKEDPVASLQARHQRTCNLGRPWTTFAHATKAKGCTCTPLYHVVHRANGDLVREPVGHNRKEAERALDARRGHIATRTYRVLRDITFEEWSREWLEASTAKPKPSASTKTRSSTAGRRSAV